MGYGICRIAALGADALPLGRALPGRRAGSSGSGRATLTQAGAVDRPGGDGRGAVEATAAGEGEGTGQKRYG